MEPALPHLSGEILPNSGSGEFCDELCDMTAGYRLQRTTYYFDFDPGHIFNASEHISTRGIPALSFETGFDSITTRLLLWIRREDKVQWPNIRRIHNDSASISAYLSVLSKEFWCFNIILQHSQLGPHNQFPNVNSHEIRARRGRSIISLLHVSIDLSQSRWSSRTQHYWNLSSIVELSSIFCHPTG